MVGSACKYLVALEQCGLELQGPHMLTRTKRLIPSREVDAAALGRDALRYHAWDPEAVRARYEGLDPAATYEIEAVFACERSQQRVLAVQAGGDVLGEVTLRSGGATIARVAVSGSAIRDGGLEVAIERRQGPDALVSELRLFSSKPVPPVLTVVGDSRGGLIGTVSDAAYAGVAGAEVVVSWVGGELRTTSGDNGVFRIPLREVLPVGQQADLLVSAVSGGLTATERIDTRTLALGLRELPPRAERMDLAGEWRFLPGRVPDAKAPQWQSARIARVPGHVAFDGLIPDGGVATLRKTFAVPGDWADEAVFARFDGAYGRAEVFLNGEWAGTHSSGATSFDVDLTALARPGDNDLTVVLTEATPHTVIDYMSWYAHTSLLGIWREARLFHVPKVHLGPTQVGIDWDPASGVGSLAITTDIVNSASSDKDYALELSISDGGHLLHRTTLSGEVAAAGGVRRQVNVQVPDVEPWSAEVPRLYDLEMVLRAGDGHPATYRRRVGFRRIEARNRQLLVNGAPIRLTGVNRHDARMLTGRAMRHEDLRHDVLALRQANVNVIRTSHYPADPRLLELCDELGMYVDDQMPVCFAAGFDDHNWARANDSAQLVPLVLEVTAETVARDQRHPCVIIWDLANETKWGWGFDVQMAMVRQMDPSRPTLFSFDLNQLGDTNPLPPKQAPERPDIRTYHYPGWDRTWQEDLDWLRSYDQPAVLSETFGPFQDNARAPLHADILAVDPGVRDYWVTGCKPFMARAMQDRGLIGGMIWNAVDDEWVLPLDETLGLGNWSHLNPLDYYRVRDVHPPQDGLVFRGEGEWGLLDGFGRARPELWHVHKLYSPIEVVRAEFAEDGQRLQMAVRNRYAHRRLETLDVRLSGAVAEGAGGCARIVTMPGETGDLTLAVAADAERVELEFRHPEGWLVDAFGWDVPGRVADIGAAIRAGAEPVRAALDTGGQLTLACGETWLRDWPRVHIQDASHPLDPMPSPDVDLSHARVGPDGTITVPLGGAGWTGSMTVRVAGGEVEIEYTCTYSGQATIDAREVGLAFTLPATMTDLWWDRLADWPAYPQGHIGRPRGYAKAAPGKYDPLRPAARWEDDATAGGNNDFRSAKRNIRAAGLTDGRRSISVLSDGSQHVRAALVDGVPVLHVLDWYGGVPFNNDTDHIWTAHYGTGKRITRGTSIGGRVILVCGALPAAARENTPGVALMEDALQ